MVDPYGRNLRLEMPHGDFTGGSGSGGSGGTVIKYHLMLSLGAFADANSGPGAAILRSLVKLEEIHADRLLVHYPMPPKEQEFRTNLLNKIQSEMAEKLEGSSAFVIIAGKKFGDFHGDMHSFAVIDFDDYFNDGGALNEKQLSKDLQAFSGLIASNNDIIQYIQNIPVKRPSWIDAWELKPGVFGIRFDLRKYAQQKTRK